MNDQNLIQQPNFLKHDEEILVVKRSLLLPAGSTWQGIKTTGLQEFLTTVMQEKEFLPRSIMENDPLYKQVIPYLIFAHEDRFFLMQRQAQASEQRLKNKYSLGIGGHIVREDLSGSDIMGWARREFNEEIDYSGSYTVTPLGILNDDSNAVGQVHVGYVLLLQGDSANIKIRSELKSGTLLPLIDCEAYYPQMETWSQHVFDALKAL